MLPRQRQRRRRRIDAGHLLRAAGQRRQREAAGVAVAVEHLGAAEVAHRLRKVQPVVALVQVGAGLVALRHVHLQLPAMLADAPAACRRRRAASRCAAGRPSSARTPASERSYSRVQPGGGQQRVGDHVLPALAAGKQELRAQRVGIAVDHQAGQAVGLAMHQAHAVAVDRQARAQGHRALHAPREEGGVDALGLDEAPGAHADGRLRAVRAPGQEAAVVGLDAHRLARVGLALVDAAGKHPGVAALQRALLAFAQADRLHGVDRFFARGCAAS